jgi:hypothetical protein
MGHEIKMTRPFNKLGKVFSVGGQICISLKSFQALFYLSEKQIFRFINKKILKAFKWKHTWYIFLPKKKVTTINASSQIISPNQNEKVELPNGKNIDLNWSETIPQLPEDIAKKFKDNEFNFFVRDNELYIVLPIVNRFKGTYAYQPVSLGVGSKNQSEIIPLPPLRFPATTDYRYGRYIFYEQSRMSVFANGGGTLKSTQIPAAFFELCRELDAAEQNRNGANPGIAPRRNLSTTVSFDTGTIAVAATIPVIVSVAADGSIGLAAQDYLGATYSTFDPGTGGDLTSTTVMAAFLEMSSLLAAAEKEVTPIDAQPNNIQISFDLEAGNATVSANLPFTTLGATNGDVTIHAIDYL